MATVQTTYPNVHGELTQGQIVNTQTADIDSLEMHGTTNLMFGMMAIQRTGTGATERQIVPGANADEFRGIAVQDERVKASNATLSFVAGDIVPVLYRGDIAVKVSAAVVVGDNAVAATAASGTVGTAAREEVGQLSSKAADATHIAVPNARFLTAASAQGIAVVRLAGLVVN